MWYGAWPSHCNSYRIPNYFSSLLQAWSGHPHIACIDNRTLFKEKVLNASIYDCVEVFLPLLSKDFKVLFSSMAIDRILQWANALYGEVDYASGWCHLQESQCSKPFNLDCKTKIPCVKLQGNYGNHLAFPIFSISIVNCIYVNSREEGCLT